MKDDTRTIEEAYICATHSSNLRCDTRDDAPCSDADILTAAGWSQSRIGGVLLRLHTEFDGAEHPRVATATQFSAVGAAKEALQVGAATARAHNVYEARMLFGRLKSLPNVRMQLTLQMTKWGAVDAEEKAIAVARWWLHPLCPSCNGTKFQTVSGTNRHSGKTCRACCGTGQTEVPHGNEGKRLLNFMDDCVQRARQSIRHRLHGSMERG